MNREILFRGKRLDNGEWAESVCPLGVMHSGHLCDDFIPATVGQYTGLTDKNGKRIFEGDLLRCFSEKTGREGDGVCVINFGRFKDTDSISDFDQVGWYITISTLPGEATTICALEEEDILFEVIGNAIDNPELLEGGEINA